MVSAMAAVVGPWLAATSIRSDFDEHAHQRARLTLRGALLRRMTGIARAWTSMCRRRARAAFTVAPARVGSEAGSRSTDFSRRARTVALFVSWFLAAASRAEPLCA